MKNNKYILISFISLMVFGVPWLVNNYPKSANFIDGLFTYVNESYALVFMRNSITVNQLQDKYDSVKNAKQKIRILIAPGHEPGYGGAEYSNLKERELNVEVSKYLKDFFTRDNHYEVIITRNNNSWDSEIQKYFTDNWNEIISFTKKNKEDMIHLVNTGSIVKVVDGVKHNAAAANVALRLFGINKWVNENKIDIAIHIHFNDYPRRNASIQGDYSGFSIYVPEKQYSNSTTTKIIADAVMKRLSKYNAISNMPKENSGVTEDQDLIAIGTFNTLDAPSMLIEYGYIYETQFADVKSREMILKDLAFQTYLGVQDFFDAPDNPAIAYDTVMLPHLWKDSFDIKNFDRGDVLSLQTALTVEGFYPGEGKTKNDCPITGKFGPCTIQALSNFQKKYGINDEKGMVGNKTINILNTTYSPSLRQI